MSLLIGRKVECQQVMFHQSKCTADNTERILTLRGGRRVLGRGGCFEWTGSGEPRGSRKQPQGFHCFTLLYFPPYSVSVAPHHSAPLIRKKGVFEEPVVMKSLLQRRAFSRSWCQWATAAALGKPQGCLIEYMTLRSLPCFFGFFFFNIISLKAHKSLVPALSSCTEMLTHIH